jgi:hypothetical protein
MAYWLSYFRSPAEALGNPIAEIPKAWLFGYIAACLNRKKADPTEPGEFAGHAHGKCQSNWKNLEDFQWLGELSCARA